jgi:hypothetical protein
VSGVICQSPATQRRLPGADWTRLSQPPGVAGNAQTTKRPCMGGDLAGATTCVAYPRARPFGHGLAQFRIGANCLDMYKLPLRCDCGVEHAFGSKVAADHVALPVQPAS